MERTNILLISIVDHICTTIIKRKNCILILQEWVWLLLAKPTYLPVILNGCTLQEKEVLYQLRLIPENCSMPEHGVGKQRYDTIEYIENDCIGFKGNGKVCAITDIDIFIDTHIMVSHIAIKENLLIMCTDTFITTVDKTDIQAGRKIWGDWKNAYIRKSIEMQKTRVNLLLDSFQAISEINLREMTSRKN